MALVRDPKSESEPAMQKDEEDLEDGEIEDDGDDDMPVEPPPPPIIREPEPTQILFAPKFAEVKGDKAPPPPIERDRSRDVPRRNSRHEDTTKKVKHMTEAEKSILHLRKRERLQREKWEKYRKEQESPDVEFADDFASNIEKAIAMALKKDKPEDDKDKDIPIEDRRGRKRKNKDREKMKNKQRKLDSPIASGEFDEGEFLNMRGGSPAQDKTPSTHSTDSFDDSEGSSERGDKRGGGGSGLDSKKKNRNKGRNRDRDRKFKDKNRDTREKRTEQQLKDAQGVCVFFLQGKCQKNNCPYSHEAVPPMKLELCKFYLKDCCAKGENCSYMHSEFPCKFYHTGLPCLDEDNCKFAHGKALNEGLKQVLYKHIETAPREILGGFPRMSREEALEMINNTQQHLLSSQYPDGIKKDDVIDIDVPPPMELAMEEALKAAKTRNRPSRWQDLEPKMTSAPPPLTTFGVFKDQDMRVNSNGDIDMRTLPLLDKEPKLKDLEEDERKEDVDIRNASLFSVRGDIDIRHQTMDPRILATKDVDIRQQIFDAPGPSLDEDESKLQIVEDRPVMPDLPRTQRELYLRIQAQQKDNAPDVKSDEAPEIDENINWYSDDDDDDDDDRLTIKVDTEDVKEDMMSPPKPAVVTLENLGDLSKIDISAEVTKLLTSITSQAKPKETAVADPRPIIARLDPRKARDSIEDKDKKLSIYEQGSIAKEEEEDLDLRARPDVDLRNLHLPFKGMMNYTPAKEIDASVSSHAPIPWLVHIVDIPRPDYTGLKLNIQDAEKTGDPRLRKIFRLSTDEKDSPASPKASPKASTRIDPRLRKMEETKSHDSNTLTYNQQLNILQSSVFFQSLTSNQKVLLNQELASRNDQNGLHDPILNSLLTNLNLIPSSNMNSSNMGTALNILANVNKLQNPMIGANPIMNQGPMMNQMAQSMVQPGLLGAAPGIPNLPPDFPINFDPRNGGLLGNAPPTFNANFPDNFNNGNFNDDYYPNDNFGQGQGSGNNGGNNRGDHHHRGFNRDRRRGRNNFNNRNNGNRNFRNNRNNRSNRSHTPP